MAANPDIRISEVASDSVHGRRSAMYGEDTVDDFDTSGWPLPGQIHNPNEHIPLSSPPIATSKSKPERLTRLRVVPSPLPFNAPSRDRLSPNTGREPPRTSSGIESDSVLGGPYSLEPEPITAVPDTSRENIAARVVRQELYLSPSPVSYFMEGDNSRYRPRPIREGEGLKTINGMNALPYRDKPGRRWESFVHPEGNRYFRYKNFITSEDLYDDRDEYATLHYVEESVRLLMDELSQYQFYLQDEIEIAISLTNDEDKETGVMRMVGCYTLVNMRLNQVFYLDDKPDGYFYPYWGTRILSREHLDRIIEAAYWEHVFMFPHQRKLSKDELADLEAELLWHLADAQTSPASTAAYTTEELQILRAIVKDIKTDGRHHVRPHYIVTFARLKSSLCKAGFVRYHGEYCVQMDSYHSLREWPESPVYFKIITWFFFFTPQIYLERLQRVCVDHLVDHQRWRKLNAELQEDWSGSITPATIILTTNVGFLAIQSVDQNGSAVQERSVGQILSYMSTMLSLGIIVASTVLAKQHRPSLSYAYPTEMIKFLGARIVTHRTMERLAIVYAIPMAFFLWALLTFFLAVGWVCFNNTSTVTRCAVGVTVVIAAILPIWVIHNGDWNIRAQAVAAFTTRMDQTKDLVNDAKHIPRRFGTKLRNLSSEASAHSMTWISMRRPSRRSTLEPRIAESAEDRPTAPTQPSSPV